MNESNSAAPARVPALLAGAPAADRDGQCDGTVDRRDRAASPSDIDARGFSWPLIVLAGTFLGLLWRPELLYDPDTYWHIAAGRWILESGTVPTADPFSHTMAGAPWTAHEWLSEIILASAFDWAGWGGVIMLPAAGLAAALAILTRYLLRHFEPVHALMFVAMAASLAMPHLLARPHALAFPLVVLWCVGLARAREADRAPPYRFVLVMAVWANLHGGYPIGLALAGVFAAEAVLAAGSAPARWRAILGWGCFLAATLAASLLTPHGVEGWKFAVQVHDMEFTLNVLSEWRSPDFHRFQPLEFWIMVAAAVILTRGIRMPAIRLVLILGLLHLSLKHARHAELLGLLAPVIVASPFATQWRSSADAAQQAVRLDRVFAALARPARPAAIAVTMALVAALTVTTLRVADIRPMPELTPAAALSAASEVSRSGRVLNAYRFGGYLIFSGIAPFIDGRADLYGDAFVETFFRSTKLDTLHALPELLDRHEIAWTLLAPDMPAVALLDRLPGWQRLYADDVAVVHVKAPHPRPVAERLLAREATGDVIASGTNVMAAASPKALPRLVPERHDEAATRMPN